jgi:hypothetical protein
VVSSGGGLLLGRLLSLLFGNLMRRKVRSSLLAEDTAPVNDAWLQPAVSAAEFFAAYAQHARTYVQPEVRASLEAEIAADRAAVEATLQSGDELRPWRHPPYQDGCVGLAVVRGGKVVLSWLTARLV